MPEPDNLAVARRHPSTPFRGVPFFKDFSLSSIPKENPMLVKQIMSHPVVSCRVNDRASLVAQRMWDNDCGVIPVLDASSIVPSYAITSRGRFH